MNKNQNHIELARQLKRLNHTGGISTSKGILEATPKDISLEDALDLSYQTEGFSILRESVSPADYAKAELNRCSIPLKEELFTGVMLSHYGEKLMEKNKAVTTPYGILITLDGQMVEQCLARPEKFMNQPVSGFSGGPVMGGME